ncbi:MAG: stage III sporulation protein AG [Oscillospiraceae bacterium]
MKLFAKYKYVMLVVAAGIFLLVIPTIGGKTAVAPEKSRTATEFSLTELEQKLESALSQIEGAGRVTVVLTAKEGTRSVLASDERENNGESQQNVVVVATGSGTQEQIYPELQGALLVCPGAGEATVRLKLMESVAALTDLGTDKIAICKSK